MYNHRLIEKKWQKIWKTTQAFKTTNDKNKKYYALDMFPYPSGDGLHVGHPIGYTATDIVARYKRLNGFDVLHPIGWDAFGLPAEQYAINTGNHPEKFTLKNIDNFRRQLQSLGFSYDYEKEVNTTDPEFYAQTQWIFIKIYEKGLAELRNVEVNWCQELGTVLANEEVVTLPNGDKVSERGNFPVVKKPMLQWVLKITDYADRLYKDLDLVNWPESLISLQRNWIKNPDGSLHLRDWIFSRQRYWGEPFPVAYDSQRNIYIINDLPILLPHLKEIKPSGTGESPLVNAKQWLKFHQNGKLFRRETNTMPQWAGSSWYYLAYILKNSNGKYYQLGSKQANELFKKWLPVDLYIGGQEHATLHLLYARFWHKVLYDLNLVPTSEPFLKIVNQGMLLGTDGHKMSKSRGNVVNPDAIVQEYGADALRVYEMFMGPLEDVKKWSNDGIGGIRRWLDRVHNTFKQVKIIKNSSLTSQYHQFLKDINNNIDKLKFNVAISNMMVFVNHVVTPLALNQEEYQGFAIVLSLFAPHLAEEILSFKQLEQIKFQTWPNMNPKLIKPAEVVVGVQVNGKLRTTLLLSKPNMTKASVLALALKNDNVKKYVGNFKIINSFWIQNKLLNIVVKTPK